MANKCEHPRLQAPDHIVPGGNKAQCATCFELFDCDHSTTGRERIDFAPFMRCSLCRSPIG